MSWCDHAQNLYVIPLPFLFFHISCFCQQAVGPQLSFMKQWIHTRAMFWLIALNWIECNIPEASHFLGISVTSLCPALSLISMVESWMLSRNIMKWNKNLLETVHMINWEMVECLAVFIPASVCACFLSNMVYLTTNHSKFPHYVIRPYYVMMFLWKKIVLEWIKLSIWDSFICSHFLFTFAIINCHFHSVFVLILEMFFWTTLISVCMK